MRDAATRHDVVVHAVGAHAEQQFSAVLHKAGIFHKAEVKDGKAVFKINNGKYYDRLGRFEIFYEALAGLPDDIRPLMIYCCVAMARALQHINDRRTVSKDWLEVDVNLHCLAAALLVAFGDHIVKPAFFQLVKKIGDELFDNRRVERAVHAVWNSKFSVRRRRRRGAIYI